jgi:hypothetical protein
MAKPQYSLQGGQSSTKRFTFLSQLQARMKKRRKTWALSQMFTCTSLGWALNMESLSLKATAVRPGHRTAGTNFAS